MCVPLSLVIYTEAVISLSQVDQQKKRPFRPFPLSPSDPRWKEIDQKLEPDHHARIVERQVNQLISGAIEKELIDPRTGVQDRYALGRLCGGKTPSMISAVKARQSQI